MNEDQLKLRQLFEQLTNNEITREEFDELFVLINNSGQEENVKSALMAGLENEQLRETIGQERLNTVLRGILSAAHPPDLYAEAPVRRMVFGRRLAAAAAILLLIGAGVWFGLLRTRSTDVAKTEQTGKRELKNDVAPGTNKAILTLADNSTVVLDSAHTGKVAQQGGTTVNNSISGQLAYDTKNEKPTNVLYNTLTTPRGGQYQLVLPDGSKVWLNAASSIRYPTAFAGDERKVEITGEAYFEVAKDAKKPFRVHFTSAGREGAVEVLGTHFNVNAYDDEPTIKTTLLEGSVKVTKDAASAILRPGQQASVSPSTGEGRGEAISVQTADVDQAVAWKNGRFYFENADIKTIMRQVSRWYDVEVVYEGKIPAGHFRGKPAMNLTAAQMLKIVEYSGVKFRIEGKKIIISE